MENKNYYGNGGRLTKSANPKLVGTAFKHDSHDSPLLIDGLHIADLVHTIGLFDAGIIPKKEAVSLINGLLEISEKELTIIPELGDVYNSKEFALKSTIGDTAGWLHLGRARREAINNGFLISYRQSVLKLQETIIRLCETFIKISGDNQTTLMTDFTYMLHAQPTTLGHYLGTYLSPLLRDLERLRTYYERLRISWAGIGSVNGSRLPIDRELLSKLMACEKPAGHLRDAMWMPDIFNEGMFILSNTLTNINRFVQELIVWNTKEFGYLEIDDSYARASVIMPQKKNPYPLSYLRGLCNEVLGKLTSFMIMSKEPSGFPDSRIFIYGDILRYYSKVNEGLDMFSDFLHTLTWKKDKMHNSVIDSYSYATDLAEEICLSLRIDYKSVHKLVGKCIREHKLNKDKDLISNLEKLISENGIKISEELRMKLIQIIDIIDLPNSRKAVGGASNESMNQWLKTAKEIVDNNKLQFNSFKLQFNSIEERINSHLKLINYEFPIFRTPIKA